MFPLGSVPSYSLYVREDYAPTQKEINLANVAIDQASDHLPLAYLEVSLSNFTNTPHGPGEIKSMDKGPK